MPTLIMIRGEIDDALARRVIGSIAAARPGCHLKLVIHSAGGYIAAAARIVAAIKGSAAAVVAAHVGRYCASAAVDIFLAAEFRTASPGAEFYLHYTEADSSALPRARLTATTLRKVAADIDRSDRELRTRLSSQLKLRHDQMLELVNGSDLRLDARAALAAGLVHRVRSESRGRSPTNRTRLSAIRRRQEEYRTTAVARLLKHGGGASRFNMLGM